MEIGAHKGVALAIGFKAIGNIEVMSLKLVGGYYENKGCTWNIIALLREIEEPPFRHRIAGPIFLHVRGFLEAEMRLRSHHLCTD